MIINAESEDYKNARHIQKYFINHFYLYHLFFICKCISIYKNTINYKLKVDIIYNLYLYCKKHNYLFLKYVFFIVYKKTFKDLFYILKIFLLLVLFV